ncbi:MAG: hypothetical protein ABL936_14080 [Aestuariivirga sp.]
MEKPGFLIQHLMIAGLLAAIGVVVFAGQSHAGNRYCTYYPEDPNCYEALYGQRGVSQVPGDEDGQFEDGDFTFQPPPPRPRAKSAASCQSIGRALRQHGYRQVRPVDCDGVNYKYVAYLGYQRYLLRVNSLDGAIVYEINY